MISPFNLASKMLFLKGKPLDLSGRPYLKAIYESPAQRLILKFARQSEKSTSLSAKIVINSVCIPYFNTLFVSPSASQSKDFSNDRLNDFLKSSPYIADNLFDSTCTDRIDQKTLLNGSNVYIRYAFLNADRTRGLSADNVCCDELQDILTSNLSVIEESASHSPRQEKGAPYKSFIYSGTPKTTNNAIEFYWSRSTQREWANKCSGCGHWNLELGLKNIGKEFLVCSRCQIARLYPAQGQWIKTNPGSDIEGFHLCQLQTSWMDWKSDILFKLNNYPQARFYNEVLGLSYDSGSKPLTTALMRACCNPNRTDWYAHDDPQLPTPTVAGIDWGLTGEVSFTILTIGAWMPYPDKFMILFQKKYEGQLADVNLQLEDIKIICEQYNCQLIGCDWGAGLHNNLKLMDHYGTERVCQFYNSGSQKNRVNWNQERLMFTIGRTTVMTDLFNLIEKRRIEFPSWNLYQKFADDFLAINIEYNRDNIMYYDHSPATPDDAVHSTMYCMLAGELFYTGRP